MPEYLDAGVVRIQSYIARTPELSLRRGRVACNGELDDMPYSILGHRELPG